MMKNRILGLTVTFAILGLMNYKYNLLSLQPLTDDQKRILQLGPIREAMARPCPLSRSFTNWIYSHAIIPQNTTFANNVDFDPHADNHQKNSDGSIHLYLYDTNSKVIQVIDNLGKNNFEHPDLLQYDLPYIPSPGHGNVGIYGFGFSPDGNSIVIASQTDDSSTAPNAKAWNIRQLRQLGQWLKKPTIEQCELLQAFNIAVKPFSDDPIQRPQRVYLTPDQMRVFRTLPQNVQTALRRYLG